MTTPEGTIKNRTPWLVAGGLGAAALLVTITAKTIEKTDPEAAFIRGYMQHGQCLDNTPYDIDKQALIHIDEVGGESVLSVTPRAANTYTPSVLFLVVDSQGLLRTPKFRFADHQTGAVVTQQDCPDQPNGY